MKSEVEVIEEMQKVVEQMRLDDIAEDPDTENEFFDCDCCGKTACIAGSIQYENYRLCNNCVLLAEVGFELKKIKNIQDFMDIMADKRLENLCDFIKTDEGSSNN